MSLTFFATHVVMNIATVTAIVGVINASLVLAIFVKLCIPPPAPPPAATAFCGPCASREHEDMDKSGHPWGPQDLPDPPDRPDLPNHTDPDLLLQMNDDEMVAYSAAAAAAERRYRAQPPSWAWKTLVGWAIRLPIPKF